MRVNEIFGSIDGEGLRTGELVTFIRLAGCNLRCSYCDTDYALKITDGKDMSVEEILQKAKEIGYKNITLTGGEPLIHKDVSKLILSLIEEGYEVNIETSGSVDISLYKDLNVLFTLDYKTPSSGMEHRMYLKNFEHLRENDVLKFVMAESDIPRVKEVLKKYDIPCYIYFSPIFEKIEPYQLVDFLKELHEEGYDTSKMRVQVQLHKIIWDPKQKGV